MDDKQRELIVEALKKVQDPELKRDIVALGMLKNVAVSAEGVTVELELTSASESLKQQLTTAVEAAVHSVAADKRVTLNISQPAKQNPAFQTKQPIPGVKSIIAVASGKGGVGKSTVTVNLALALKKQGYKVGIMDGDIYGPNIPLMLGISADARPQVNPQNQLIPINAQGMPMISMGVLVPADQPMVWRGPMLHSAVTQFVQKVEWGELDYLLIDLPPGTGDVQLSLVQTVPLTGAVIVTTPQEVALMDVRKGVMMLRKTEVPILGVVENMAGDIFGEGGGEKAAEQFEVPFLGRIPLEGNVRSGGDSGKPVVAHNNESSAANAFEKVAESLIANLKSSLTV